MHRRNFLRAAAGFAALKADSIHMAQAAAATINHQTAEASARDEDFRREIQQAFTVDRNIINLNNGGVSPSPRVVQEAMRRYLEISNMAPSYNLWDLLEPEVESVRRGLAATFGCRTRGTGHHAERLGIARNLPDGAGLEARRRGAHHRSGLSARAQHLGPACAA